MVIKQHVPLVVSVKNLMVIEHLVYHVHQDKQEQVVLVLFVLMARNLIATVLVYLVELVTRVWVVYVINVQMDIPIITITLNVFLVLQDKQEQMVYAVLVVQENDQMVVEHLAITLFVVQEHD